jgi:hypothetical protein
MFGSRLWVSSGVVAAILVVVACSDSTRPRTALVRTDLSIGGSAACFRVTGGGRIDKPEPSTPVPQPKNSDRNFATFGIHAGPTACNSTSGVGEIEWSDHSPSAPGGGFKFHGTVSSFGAVVDHYYPNRVCATFSGTGQAKAHNHSFDQQVSFTIDHACDEGQPGVGRAHLRMIINLAGGTYDRAGILTGGNIHQHSLKPPSPSTGTLAVSNTTTGSNFPTSYTVTVDAGTASAISQTMVPNGSTTFTGLSANTHSVTLSNIASNCTVTSTNPQSVTVTAGATTNATFTVSCTAPSATGTLTVSNTTTGSVPTTSYTVTVSGTPGTASQPMAPNGSTTFSNVPPATYTVQLSGQPANCTVTSTNPQTVTVTAGATTNATFTVSCAAPPTGTEISGTGQIGTGSPTVGNNVQTFTFDVRSNLTGTLVIKHYGAAAPDLGPETATVNPTTDPATGITAFSATFTSTSDPAFSNCTTAPSRGAEFDVIARRNDGPNGSPGSLIHIHVVACDNGPAGSGLDFFGFRVQENSFTRSGFLTSGDIVKSSF